MAIRDQVWMTEHGLFYALKKTSNVAYRRRDDGPWEQIDAPSAEEVAQLERVGHDRIDTGWYTVYRAPQ